MTVLPHLPAAEPAGVLRAVCLPLQYNIPHQHATFHMPSNTMLHTHTQSFHNTEQFTHDKVAI